MGRAPTWPLTTLTSAAAAVAKAIGAIRHDILIAYWHIVTADVGYQDLGVDWVARRHSREHQIARLAKQIEKLSAAVEITMPAA